MELYDSGFDLLVYLLIYGLLGWTAEVCVAAVRRKRFVNRGFLNLPLVLPHGIAAVILMLGLPTLENGVLQYLMCWVVVRVVFSFSDHIVERLRRAEITQSDQPRWKEELLLCLMAGVYLVLYLVVHPLIFGLVTLMPGWLVRLIGIAGAAAVAMDVLSVIYTLHSRQRLEASDQVLSRTNALAQRLSRGIWNRLEKNYPDLLTGPQECTFARGICFDKLVWVFLLSAFLGDLIEMVYCRVVGGTWMSRSSVLYGAFSFVWGFGAVVLTVALRRLADKPDRRVFAAGFVLGGAYEYLCSVFTELVFGTVFWDYSEMPLNIGGRTNVMFCIFWGILSVVWLRVIYPPMERCIEQLPVLAGKILTWCVVVLMVCNGALTSAAMVRYTNRQTSPAPENVIEVFLDTRYDDAWMEHRWPNMVLTGDRES